MNDLEAAAGHAVLTDRVFKTKSSEEPGHLTRIVEWAKAARLVRVTGTRLLPVKKNASLLDRCREAVTLPPHPDRPFMCLRCASSCS